MDPVMEPHFTEQLKQQRPYWQTKRAGPRSGNTRPQGYSSLVFKNPIIVTDSITYSLSLYVLIAQWQQTREP